MKELNLLQLRLRGEMLQKIDENIERRYPHKETRPPRHAWFIETFLEKLERENPNKVTMTSAVETLGSA
jgi:hypothetical protein